MARKDGVWGIEIGQSALKALRCRFDGTDVVAEAYEYIEYPKLLSQPEAEPDLLVAEAMQQFLDRNETREYRVAISVPGQSGLSKFFKPPPVEMKKIADIVRYEAKQQIPFDLNDVVWDYQLMPGSIIEEGYALESEVGLFAMKREQAYRWLKPFMDNGVEVDLVQLAPAALYNMLSYDRLSETLQAEHYNAENPPASLVLLNLGTDATDLIVTNGFRIWQRSMPIGGNHFTRQLTKELKLTFAKAEHLKRNARHSEDPKLVFQAMRPVFNDMVTEVQRSVGFFQQQNRAAKIDALLVCGNAVKLPGLVPYLGKSLGYDVHTLENFNRLSGSEVTQNPTFKDNVPTFGVCYGLCLQSLGKGPVRSTLVPREILTERLIRAKKPWALAAVASLMVGLMGHYAFIQRNWSVVHEDKWAAAKSAADQSTQTSTSYVSSDTTLDAKRTFLLQLGNEVAGNSHRRLLWPELLKTINGLLPRDPRYIDRYLAGDFPTVKEFPLGQRPDIYVTAIESQRLEDVATNWFTPRKDWWLELMRSWSSITGKPLPDGLDTDPGPTGPGWIIELRCHHFYNEIRVDEGINHVYKTLFTTLMSGEATLPVRRPSADGSGIEEQMETYTVKQLGINYPFILPYSVPQPARVPNPEYVPPENPNAAYGTSGYGGEGMSPESYGAGMSPESYGAAGAVAPAKVDPDAPPPEPPFLNVKRFDFVVQFCWQPNTVEERDELKKKALEEQKAAEEAAAEGQAEPAPAPDAVALTSQPGN